MPLTNIHFKEIVFGWHGVVSFKHTVRIRSIKVMTPRPPNRPDHAISTSTNGYARAHVEPEVQCHSNRPNWIKSKQSCRLKPSELLSCHMRIERLNG
jgi:hypothetical protein